MTMVTLEFDLTLNGKPEISLTSTQYKVLTL